MRTFVVLVATLWSAAAFAQRGQDAGLTGRIHDRTGAVLAGARVTVSSPQLIGGPQKARADASGVYTFPFLAPGTYELLVEHDGFKAARRSGIDLPPGLTFTVDIALDLATINETVLVDGPVPIIDVRTSGIPVLINRTLIESLPLSRTAADTVNLAPGVIRDVAFGGTVASNPFWLDGTNGNEPGRGVPTVHPNPNWIEELQVVSIGADARYGEFTGAQTNAITRSGSNRFAGLGSYWTTRPDWTGDNRGSLSPALQAQFRPIEIIDRWDLDAQVGGPIKLDRLWFFAGGERYRNILRPQGFATVAKTAGEPRNTNDEGNLIVKLTAAPSSSMRAEGYFARTALDVLGTNASPFVLPEALGSGRRTESMWHARLLWTASSRAFVELRHGGQHSLRSSGPPDDRRAGPPGHIDQVTNVQSVNAYYFSDYASRPVTTGAHVTYFRSGGSQSHEVRSGFEFEHASLRQEDGYSGGMVFEDSDGQPDLVDIWEGQTYRPRQNRKTAYAQDAWTIADRVTLNVGLRAGWYSGSVPGRENVFSSRSVSPRLGAAWDVGRDHKTALRVHYGRYHDEMVTSFFDFLDTLSWRPEIIAAVVGPNQYSELFRTTTAASATIDPNLRFSFAEEFMVGAERQLPFGITAKAHFIRRDFKDTIGFVDTGSIWQPFQVVDPGPDGRLGTSDDGGNVTMFENLDPSRVNLVLTNPPAHRRYRGIQIVAAKRQRHDLTFQASYTWSRTMGNYNNFNFTNAALNAVGTNGVFTNPNLLVKIDGHTPQDFTHELKVVGAYRLSRWGGLNVAGVYRLNSNRRYARQIGGPTSRIRTFDGIAVEPLGSRALDAINQLDLRVEKTWRPGSKSNTIGAFADVFNVGNQGVALTINNRSGPNFGVPNSWSDPRSLRAGVRWMF